MTPEAMWAADAASRAFGMELVVVDAGSAAIRMTVRDDMVNGHGLCHGGVIASLADSAFAMACNSRGVSTVAAGFDITFLRPARAGDVLEAVAEERTLAGRSGIYDVRVHTRGVVIAEFRGRSRALPPPR
jgi:phenylacetic acid degradation protein PaaD